MERFLLRSNGTTRYAILSIVALGLTHRKQLIPHRWIFARSTPGTEGKRTVLSPMVKKVPQEFRTLKLYRTIRHFSDLR